MMRLFLLPILLTALLTGCGPSDTPESPAASDAAAAPYRFAGSWGTSGSAPGQLREPIGITEAGGALYVSDAGNHRVQVFAPDGTFLRAFEQPADALARPMHLDVRDSAVYVPAYLGDRVQTFSLEGAPQQSFGASGTGPAQFDAPAGVAVTAQGRMYVADFFNHRVHLLGPDGAPLKQFGTTGESGPAPGQLTYPTDVAVRPGGGFVVADAYNNRIQTFGADGAFQWAVPDTSVQAGASPGRFNVATAVETGPDGRIYVADFFNHRIQIFTPEGRFAYAFGEEGTGDGQFDRPTDLTFDADGMLYVVDFGNDRVQQFAPVHPAN